MRANRSDSSLPIPVLRVGVHAHIRDRRTSQVPSHIREPDQAVIAPPRIRALRHIVRPGRIRGAVGIRLPPIRPVRLDIVALRCWLLRRLRRTQRHGLVHLKRRLHGQPQVTNPRMRLRQARVLHREHDALSPVGRRGQEQQPVRARRRRRPRLESHVAGLQLVPVLGHDTDTLLKRVLRAAVDRRALQPSLEHGVRLARVPGDQLLHLVHAARLEVDDELIE